MFKLLRVTVLLFILATVAISAINAGRHTDWEQALWVAVHPINGDGSELAARYIRQLDDGSFKRIERHLDGQAKNWGLALAQPVRLMLATPVEKQPPRLPDSPGIAASILYSLQLRWWAWRHGRDELPADIRLYVLYHDPRDWPVLPHSTGLAKGRIGIIYAYGRKDYAGSNDVVITHELLHTLGATDKYDLETSMPTYPEGYATPGQTPLYPQTRAELMAGRIAVSENRFEIPRRVHETLIGEQTAREIGWIQ